MAWKCGGFCLVWPAQKDDDHGCRTFSQSLLPTLLMFLRSLIICSLCQICQASAFSGADLRFVLQFPRLAALPSKPPLLQSFASPHFGLLCKTNLGWWQVWWGKVQEGGSQGPFTHGSSLLAVPRVCEWVGGTALSMSSGTIPGFLRWLAVDLQCLVSSCGREMVSGCAVWKRPSCE